MEEIITNENKVREYEEKNKKLAEKDWDKSWYIIKRGKLLKIVKAKNGSSYQNFVFKIKTQEQKQKVEELKKKGLIKEIEGIKAK